MNATARTTAQNSLLQAACADLSRGLSWFGQRLSQDEWRWLICAAVLGVKVVPAIDQGDGPRGVVTLGGSSRRLTTAQCSEAITLAFAIGDAPWDYEPTQRSAVRWSETTTSARWLVEAPEEGIVPWAKH